MIDQLGTELGFPHYCDILCNRIYRNCGNIITQYTNSKLLDSKVKKERMHEIQSIKRYRIGVEHAIAELKTYRRVESLSRLTICRMRNRRFSKDIRAINFR